MQAFTTRDHLIAARDHLGWNYPVTVAIAFNEQWASAHVDCDATRGGELLKVVPLEDLPPDLGNSQCAECSIGLQSGAYQDVRDTLDALIALAGQTKKLAELADLFLTGNALHKDTASHRHTNLTCDRYYYVSQYFRPNPKLGGRSHAQVDADLDPAAAVSEPIRALWNHLADLAEDATRLWTRMARLQPLRTAETLSVAPIGQPRVRAVVRDDDDPHGRTPSDPFGDNIDRALIVEAPRLLVLDDWELLDWDSRLPDNGHSVADPAGATPAELEIALTLYSQNVALDAPTLQELLDGVRTASA